MPKKFMIAMPKPKASPPATPDEFVAAGQPDLWEEPKVPFKRLTIDVPADTHRAFKALAARQGLDMKILMLAAIKDYIGRE